MQLQIKREVIRDEIKVLINLIDYNEEGLINKALKFFYSISLSLSDVENYELGDFLRMIYRQHKYLYQQLGCMDQNYSPDRSKFTGERSTGWQNFLDAQFGERYNTDLSKENLDTVKGWIKQRLSNLVEDYKESTKEYSVTMNFEIGEEDQEEANIAEILMEHDPRLITEDGIYTIQASKLQDSEGLDDIKHNITNGYKDVYENIVEQQTKTLREEIDELKNKLQDKSIEAFVEGIKFKQDDWKVEEEYLVKYVDFFPEYIVKNRKRYEINQERTPFHIEKIKVKIDKYPGIAYAYGAHPNTDEDGGLCLGDLSGKPIKYILENIEKTLNICNLDSAHRGLDYWGKEFDEVVNHEIESTIWEDMR